jgi:hypothetical protein
MPTHETLSGHAIEYERPSTKVAAFLKRLREMLDDSKVDEQQMIGVAYSADNPILAPDLFPGRGAVTREVLADPVYHVMADLLARKHFAQRGQAPSSLEGEHTMSVAAAAADLGITEDAVRKAIAARRLPSWFRDGRHMLHPRSVAAFGKLLGETRPGRERQDQRSEAERKRDARSAEIDRTLEVKLGNVPGTSFRVSYRDELGHLKRVEGNVHEGTIDGGWKKIAVLANSERFGLRFWLLEPKGPAVHEIALDPFFVRGRFTEQPPINNAKRAKEAWEAFEAK